LDPVDVIGDQSMGLPMNCGRGVRGRCLDQAEDPPDLLVDPVPEIADFIFVLRLQVGEMGLVDVFISTPPGTS
jgi:hypothetical protein